MAVNGPQDIIGALGLRRKRGQLYQYVRETAQDIGKAGEEFGRHVIQTSPTTADWSNFYRGPRQKAADRRPTGRVDTGNMLDSYTNKITKNGSDYAIEIGWVGGDPDNYFEDQEYGFEWVSDDGNHIRNVPGMYAQERSQEDVHLVARALLARMKRRLEATP